MLDLYTRPLRVYIILGALALWGIISGVQLPVSLFPNSSQVRVAVDVPYGSMSPRQFFETYGKQLESELQAVKIEGSAVQLVKSNYRTSGASYRIQFDWGANPDQTLREVQNIVSARFASAEEDIRIGTSVESWRQNQGFLAISFYSPMRSLDEIYNILEPLVTPIRSKVSDAENMGLYNPNGKEVTITPLFEKLAQYEVTTLQLHKAIQEAVTGMNGGLLKVGENEYQLELPKYASDVQELGQIQVSKDRKKFIFLKDVARISVGLSAESKQKFRTSGTESLILFANPKEGGNIKNMADQITLALEKLQPQWPEDIQFKVLVNPSEFINKSIIGVLKEVFLAAFLAVLVLFVFIGSFKNVVTAAIEIPLSLLMAFILMKLTGMNLNLISLGGLALSAGMNVDASVVVLENIFRHFDEHKKQAHRNANISQLTYAEKAHILVGAVKEVRLPIIASTVASLVVFMPLIFTKGLTNSLLGDLAKAVIFSHGLSAFVALLLVPTIRLHLLSKGNYSEAHSPVESWLKKLENLYKKSLNWFLLSGKAQVAAILLVIISLPVLISFVIPKLNKEVIGRPESDWLIVGVYSPLFNSTAQLESELDLLEVELMRKFSDKVAYTFTQVQGEQNGFIMLRLKNRKDITDMMNQAEENFKNTATKFFFVEQWNPSELRIPDPPQMRLEITGGTPLARLYSAQDLQGRVLEKGIYDKTEVTPTSQLKKGIVVRDMTRLGSQQEVLTRLDISHYLRVATTGVYISRTTQQTKDLPIYLRLPKYSLNSVEQLNAIPIGFEGRLIPMGALVRMSLEEQMPDIYRENQQDLIVLTGRLNKVNLPQAESKKLELKKVLEEYAQRSQTQAPQDIPAVIEAVPDQELQDALAQLKWAIGISIFLIFITMILQLGDVVQSLLVLVAIPLGFVGVILSLWIFKSTLSLNSGLGTILLNGIAVANSIILVDFIQKLFASGKGALQSTLEASVARLRPILMTSLTTGLGMLPVALGMGDGGKILQPLGIAVCGGLWVSTLLTLFLVPALQYQYLNRKPAEKKR